MILIHMNDIDGSYPQGQDHGVKGQGKIYMSVKNSSGVVHIIGKKELFVLLRYVPFFLRGYSPRYVVRN